MPTNFNVETFTKAGVVPSKLHALPEAVDIDLYDPYVVRGQAARRQVPAAIHKEVHARSARVNFLSNFKFEERKNWVGLLDAYLTEFQKTDDVALFIFTHEAWEGPPHRGIEKAMKATAESLETTVEELPKVHIIDARLRTRDMPFLYAAMDAFVLPTHGEGWGLPILEALLMEVPLIVTDWGGSTEFAGGPGFPGFPIGVESMEVAWGNPEKGKWAVPSQADLMRHMRTVFSDPKKAQEKGKQARLTAIDKYSHEAVGLLYMERLARVEAIIAAEKAGEAPFAEKTGEVLSAEKTFEDKLKAKAKRRGERKPALAHRFSREAKEGTTQPEATFPSEPEPQQKPA